MAVLVMGVSGCGKSTVGALLAHAINMRFVDADDMHSDENKTKMAAGIPLDDADREPWLDSVGVELQKGRVVIACSALRRRYRDRLRRIAPWFRLIYLYGTPKLLAERLSVRVHEFMPSNLLSSQLATLEPPDADERAIALNVELPPHILVEYAAQRICSAE
jgi:carbohydrate kinase (thermoresistant glucokinase family)